MYRRRFRSIVGGMTATAEVSTRTDVRKSTSADVPRLSGALARAFYDDPACSHCFPHENDRMRKLEGAFELMFERVYLRHDECRTASGLCGGALWLPPGQWKLGSLEQVLLLPRMARIYRRDLPRVLRVVDFLEARHPAQPHYYLGFLGVEPTYQGEGIGSALLAPVLDRCDDEGFPAYLEASSERNRALYERHGFDVVERIELPGDGPPMWRMWREPR